MVICDGSNMGNQLREAAAPSPLVRFSLTEPLSLPEEDPIPFWESLRLQSTGRERDSMAWVGQAGCPKNRGSAGHVYRKQLPP